MADAATSEVDQEDGIVEQQQETATNEQQPIDLTIGTVEATPSQPDIPSQVCKKSVANVSYLEVTQSQLDIPSQVCKKSVASVSHLEVTQSQQDIPSQVH